MVPAVHALLAAVLACLTLPTEVGIAPMRGNGPAIGRADGGSRADEGPGAFVEALPPFRQETEKGCETEGDDGHPVRVYPATAAAAFASAVDPCASIHPAFHAVPRSLFLLCGRLTC